jgi:hypothetical protein
VFTELGIQLDSALCITCMILSCREMLVKQSGDKICCCCCPLCVRLQGADFGNAARQKIEEKLRKGKTLAAIEWDLKNPGKPMPSPGEQRKQAEEKQKQASAAAAAAAVVEPPKPKAKAPPKVEVGQSLAAAKRDPMAMIKVNTATAVSRAVCVIAALKKNATC